MPRLLASLMLLAAGCTSGPQVCPPPGTKPGPVRYIPVPADLTAPVPHTAAPRTVGELQQAYEQLRREHAFAEYQKQRIRQLRDPSDAD